MYVIPKKEIIPNSVNQYLKFLKKKGFLNYYSTTIFRALYLTRNITVIDMKNKKNNPKEISGSCGVVKMIVSDIIESDSNPAESLY